jgi:predicted SAM-dependent methyltransferase
MPTLKQRFGAWLFPRLPVTRWLFDILRHESNGWTTSAMNAVSPSRKRRVRALQQRRSLLVNVACGPQVLDGYVNVDLHATSPAIIPWDCRRSLPLADGSAAGIRVEQFVEHLETREELPQFLRDCYRALETGGVLRVIVPDGERYLRAYSCGGFGGFRELGWTGFPDDLPTRMDIVNHVFHQWHEHRWAYDFETLRHRLMAAGFTAVEQRGFRDSMLPALAQDRDVHAPYSLYVDAVKEAARPD